MRKARCHHTINRSGNHVCCVRGYESCIREGEKENTVCGECWMCGCVYVKRSQRRLSVGMDVYGRKMQDHRILFKEFSQ